MFLDSRYNIMEDSIMLGIGRLKSLRNEFKLSRIIIALISIGFLSACNPAATELTQADIQATEDAFDTRVASAITDRMATQDAMNTKVAADVAGTVTAVSASTVDEEATSNAADAATTEALLGEADGGGGASEITAILEVNANVRTGPGVAFPIITTSTAGTTLTILGKSCGGCPTNSIWYKVQLPDEREGWTIGWAFKADSDLSNVAAVDVPLSPRIYPTVLFTPTPTPTPTHTPTGTATTTATVTPTSANVTPSSTPTIPSGISKTVIVLNNSVLAICQLLIHPSTVPSVVNRLGLDPLQPGSQLALTLTEGATFYDFEARSCGDDSLVADENGVQVFNNFVWIIED
jgi:uncharacterized protein YgiM (DUF1202 family)